MRAGLVAAPSLAHNLSRPERQPDLICRGRETVADDREVYQSSVIPLVLEMLEEALHRA